MALPRAKSERVLGCRNLDDLLGAVVFDADQFDRQRDILRREIGGLFALDSHPYQDAVPGPGWEPPGWPEPRFSM